MRVRVSCQFLYGDMESEIKNGVGWWDDSIIKVDLSTEAMLMGEWNMDTS